MGQALWRLPPRQQQQLQEELADRLSDQGGGGGGGGGGKQEQGNSVTFIPFLYHSFSDVFPAGQK